MTGSGIVTVTDRPVAHPEEPAPRGVSRRRLLGAAGVGAAVAGVGVAAGFAVSGSQPAATPEGVIPFRGQHQAGIITPAQDRLHFAAIDLTTTNRAAVMDLLQRWTRAAERMTAGAEATPGGAVNLNPDAPPTDTGEALGLPASSLTLTFGVGPWLLRQAGPRRAAARRARRRCRRSSSTRSTRRCPGATCASRRAPTTRRSPCTPSATWSGWASAPRRCGGRSSGSGARRRRRRARPRRATCSASRTARATSRPRTPTCCATTSGCRPATDPAWLEGGSYLVARRIRMHIEVWDRTSLTEQESIIGRNKGEGAPAGSPKEFDEPNLANDGHRARRAHPAGSGAEPRRGADPAARLQLRRRQRRAGPPQRGPVLPGLHARPADALRADAARARGQGPADGVHRAHGLGGVRDPARVGAAGLLGPGAAMRGC